jgi:hypothetical protein
VISEKLMKIERTGFGILPMLCGAAVLLAAGTAHAKATAEEAAKLGSTLTPIGAEKAASKDGTIPEWTGGMKEPGAMFGSYKAGSGEYYPDPFPQDKPLFTVTHENFKQYASKLPDGAAKMLERYADYSMPVYATRRTPIFPDAVYAATKANATTATTVGDDGLKDATLGFPFPVPGNGAEVVWNHKVRYRGDSVQQTGGIFAVGEKGDYQQNLYEQSAQFSYGNVKNPGKIADNLILQLLRKQTAPPRLAGSMTLVWDHLDGSREAWQYSPGTNRIRQAPIVAFDNPIAGSDGLQSTDQADMFNGSMKLYSWKLIGKKEMLIGYNPYRLLRPELKYKDIIHARHLNPKHLRYELHRVWIVEATLKPGQGNIYKRRVMYVDEDSWGIAAVDCYDARNTLWRYQEGFVAPLFMDKAVVAAPQITYDLFAGRYAVNNLPNEQGYIAKFGVSFKTGYFTPQTLQKLGRD